MPLSKQPPQVPSHPVSNSGCQPVKFHLHVQSWTWTLPLHQGFPPPRGEHLSTFSGPLFSHITVICIFILLPFLKHKVLEGRD